MNNEDNIPIVKKFNEIQKSLDEIKVEEFELKF